MPVVPMTVWRPHAIAATDHWRMSQSNDCDIRMTEISFGARSPIKMLAAGLACIAALLISLGVTANFTLASQAPDAAKALWPAGVNASVAKGLAVSVDPSVDPQQLSAAIQGVGRAAAREPSNSIALSTLATLEAYRSDTGLTSRLFYLSEKVSRRNVPTQLWMIEDAVARNDVPSALAHYDTAMRVSIKIRPKLLSLLILAAEAPDVSAELFKILKNRPIWWNDYLTTLLGSSKDAALIANSINLLAPAMSSADREYFGENALRRLVALGSGRTAVMLANQLDGRNARYRNLVAGDFGADNGILPFRWWLRDDDRVRAYRETVPGGGTGLWLTTNGDASGAIAQQMIGLAPGHYVISGRTGGVAVDPMARPSILITCGKEQTLARSPLLPSPEETSRAFRFPFTIPHSGCDVQWVNIMSALSAINVWVDDLSITRDQ